MLHHTRFSQSLRSFYAYHSRLAASSIIHHQQPEYSLFVILWWLNHVRGRRESTRGPGPVNYENQLMPKTQFLSGALNYGKTLEFRY